MEYYSFVEFANILNNDNYITDTSNKISYIKIPLDAGNFALMDKKIVQIINSIKETIIIGINAIAR